MSDQQQPVSYYTPEHVALLLMERIFEVEGKTASGKIDRVDILSTYANCISAIRDRR